MTKLAGNAVVARWLSEDLCEGYEMQADGLLTKRTRGTQFEMWSPPEDVGFMSACYDPLQNLLEEITGTNPNVSKTL